MPQPTKTLNPCAAPFSPNASTHTPPPASNPVENQPKRKTNGGLEYYGPEDESIDRVAQSARELKEANEKKKQLLKKKEPLKKTGQMATTAVATVAAPIPNNPTTVTSTIEVKKGPTTREHCILPDGKDKVSTESTMSFTPSAIQSKPNPAAITPSPVKKTDQTTATETATSMANNSIMTTAIATPPNDGNDDDAGDEVLLHKNSSSPPPSPQIISSPWSTRIWSEPRPQSPDESEKSDKGPAIEAARVWSKPRPQFPSEPESDKGSFIEKLLSEFTN